MRIHKIIFLILINCAVAATTSCTSKKVDQENAEISELAGEESAGGGDLEAASGEDEFGADESKTATGDAAASDEATTPEEDPLADNSLEPVTDANESMGNAPSDAQTTDVAAGNAENAENTGDAESAEPAAPPADSGMTSSADETQGLSEPEAPKPMIPLQKVVASPYKRGSKNINAVYVAREGDTVESVSQKIFGEDRTAELKKDNPTLARREMKVGDKVYYTSPKRAEDESSMQTYYEDMGMTPEVYLSQPGDNIRTVAQNLLGHKDSWKEIWSLNPDVESKGELPEGTRLRYWPKEVTGAAPPTDLAANPPSSEQADMNAPAPPAAGTTTDEPPPPMPEEAAPPVAEATPPPPPVEAAPPPPPPPVAEVAPPPPPQAAQPMGAAFGDDPDQLMALGAGAILLLAAVALFIIIRKKRARRSAAIDFQTATHTQQIDS